LNRSTIFLLDDSQGLKWYSRIDDQGLSRKVLDQVDDWRIKIDFRVPRDCFESAICERAVLRTTKFPQLRLEFLRNVKSLINGVEYLSEE